MKIELTGTIEELTEAIKRLNGAKEIANVAPTPVAEPPEIHTKKHLGLPFWVLLLRKDGNHELITTAKDAHHAHHYGRAFASSMHLPLGAFGIISNPKSGPIHITPVKPARYKRRIKN